MFDIEGTRVTDPQRIARLLIPIALCYALYRLEGVREQATGEVHHIAVLSGIDMFYPSVA